MKSKNAPTIDEFLDDPGDDGRLCFELLLCRNLVLHCFQIPKHHRIVKFLTASFQPFDEFAHLLACVVLLVDLLLFLSHVSDHHIRHLFVVFEANLQFGWIFLNNQFNSFAWG